jgi:hypothetical protein
MIPRRGKAVNAFDEWRILPTGRAERRARLHNYTSCNFFWAKTYYYMCAESDHKRFALCRGYCICQKYCTATAAAAIAPPMHAFVLIAALRSGWQPLGQPHGSPASSALRAAPIIPSMRASAWSAGARLAPPSQRSHGQPRHQLPLPHPHDRQRGQATRAWPRRRR